MTWDSLERLGRIARAAGAVILTHLPEVPHTCKPDGTPVTEADRAAHRCIVTALTYWDPEIPALSEEEVVPPYDIRRDWPRFWLIDPLDGTKEFLACSGEYTVNIALIEGIQPVMGAVFAPALDLLYLAGRGLGAWRQIGTAAPQRIHSSPAAAGAPVVIAESRSHPSPDLETFLTTVPVSCRVRAGSSLKFCWVAEGKADLYPRFGPTMEWDTAAGDCVYRQSGRDAERSSPLRYNTVSLRHEQFVIGQ